MYQNSRFLYKIWSKLNYPQICLALFILRTIFMLKKWKLDESHKRAIIAIYLSYIFFSMTFVTEPLVYPLGHRKRRASLRESAFFVRENTNFYGILCKTSFYFRKYSFLLLWMSFTFSTPTPRGRHISKKARRKNLPI